MNQKPLKLSTTKKKLTNVTQFSEAASTTDFLISNFRRVLYVVCFLLGNSLASEFYMPMFRNIASVPSS
jgi:hypothetical protein